MARILIFDSNLKRLMDLSGILGGYLIDGATTVDDALRMINANPPDLVLADVEASDCLGLISAINSLSLAERPLVYFMGGLAPNKELGLYRQSAKSCGADGFIPRSNSAPHLLSMVHAVLVRRRGIGSLPGIGEAERSDLFSKGVPDRAVEPNKERPAYSKEEPDLRFDPTMRSVGPGQRRRNMGILTETDTGTTLGNIAKMVGGWQMLSDIAYEFKLPEDQEQHRRFLDILDGWGQKPPLQRVLKAEELTRILPDWIQRNGQDPVYLALLRVAQQTIQQTRYCFWQTNFPVLVELIGEWQVLDEILGQGGLTEPESLNRLHFHLKQWNDLGHIQAMVRAAGYCTKMISISEPDPVYQILHQAAAEILYGFKAQRIDWSNNSDGQSDDLPRAA